VTHEHSHSSQNGAWVGTDCRPAGVEIQSNEAYHSACPQKKSMFDIIAGTAGIVGLGLTVWTLIVAKQARTAAREARAAIRMDNAAEEFKKIAVIANEFLGHVEMDQVDSACVRARDLMAAMSVAAQRWKSLIPEDEVIAYDEAYAQIGVISRSLSTNGPPENAQQKQKLLKISHSVLETLGKRAGTLFSEVETRKD
jgi:hypothetical protein